MTVFLFSVAAIGVVLTPSAHALGHCNPEVTNYIMKTYGCDFTTEQVEYLNNADKNAFVYWSKDYADVFDCVTVTNSGNNSMTLKVQYTDTELDCLMRDYKFEGEKNECRVKQIEKATGNFFYQYIIGLIGDCTMYHGCYTDEYRAVQSSSKGPFLVLMCPLNSEFIQLGMQKLDEFAQKLNIPMELSCTGADRCGGY